MLADFIAESRGATTIEYALIASLVSVFIVGALLVFQGEVGEVFKYISDNLSPVIGGSG